MLVINNIYHANVECAFLLAYAIENEMVMSAEHAGAVYGNC